MPRRFFLIILLALPCSSCTVYVKDAIEGTPYERGADPAYRSALNAGFSTEQARRAALLEGSDSSRKIRDRRKKDEQKRNESRSGKKKFRWFDLLWD